MRALRSGLPLFAALALLTLPGCGAFAEEGEGVPSGVDAPADPATEKPVHEPVKAGARLARELDELLQSAPSGVAAEHGVAARQRAVHAVMERSLNRDNVHAELAGLFTTLAASNASAEKQALMATPLMRKVAEFMRDPGVRAEFTTRLADAVTPATYKRAAFDAYAKTMFDQGAAAELRAARDAWLGAARAPQRDVQLAATLLRRVGQNPEFSSAATLLEYVEDADETIREGAWWGIRNYMRTRGTPAEQDAVLGTIAALPASLAGAVALRDCLAEMKLPEANALFLKRWGGDQQALIRFAHRQAGFNDPALLAALLQHFSADNPFVTDVQIAIQAAYPEPRATAERLLAGSAEQRTLGLRLLRVFPGAAMPFRERISGLGAGASPEERVELAVLRGWFDQPRRLSLPRHAGPVGRAVAK